MAANFLHGAETIERENGLAPLRIVKAAVIGLVGTAPIWQAAAGDRTVNDPVMVLSRDDAARMFGVRAAGYTIPAALDAIFDQAGPSGVGVIVVVNVFDPAVHKASVPPASFTFAATGAAKDTATLPHQGAANLTVTNADASVTYGLDTDYAHDPLTGVLTRLAGGAIAAGATVKITYDRPAPELVTAGDVIGGVTVGGDRTGMQAWRDCANQMGFRPRLLIAPGFSALDAVASELIVSAHNLRGFGLIDAPIGVTPQQVLAGRGPDGAIAFDTSSERAVLLYPHVQVYDAATDSNVLEPFSARFAGAWSAQMVEKGYWWSPSNRELRGVVGIERKLTAGISDPSSEVNILNEAGVVTLFNAFGTGLRTWGNRTAAWPTVTHPKNFMSVRVTADVIEETIEQTMLQFIDRPGTPAMVDAVLQTVEAGLRDMAADGAIMPEFRVWFDKAKNSATQLALGHYTFSYDFMPPTPMERITFDVGIDLTLLSSLTA